MVNDSQGEPEIYATCRVYALPDTIKALITGLTDTAGVYRTALAAPGEYRLSVEGAGRPTLTVPFKVSKDEPTADLGTLILGSQELGEVTVTAQRPLVAKEIDRIGYDVQADPASKVLNLQEMLRRVPMVAVDAEGNVTINGSSNFKIYKNGRPDNSLSRNAKDLLAALPASMIKKVEVITEPGAKYDAEGIGAILNIVTVENSTIAGVTGTASLRWRTTSWIPTPSVFLTTQIDKVTLSLYGGGSWRTRYQSKNESSSEVNYKNGRRDRTESRGTGKSCFSWFGGEGSWDINKNNLVTLEMNGYYMHSNPESRSTTLMTGADGELLSSYTAVSHNARGSYLNIDGNVNYQHTTSNPGEAITASYMISTTGNKNRSQSDYEDMVNATFPYTSILNDGNMNFIEHTAQLDWKRPFRKIHTIETGAKYIFRRNHSTADNEYTGWRTLNSDFKHITNVAAVYAQYSANIGHVGLRAGLRYEFSRLEAKYPDGSNEEFASNLSDWVPSAAMNWSINQSNTLTFNYAARINRPGIEYLNPAVNYTPTTISYGNADLESAYSHSLKMTYSLFKQKVFMNASVNYSFNNDNISSVQWVDGNGMIVSTYDNIGHQRNLSMNAFVQWTATPKTQVMVNGTVSRESYRQEGLRLAKWGGYAYARISQQLPWELTIEGSAYWMGKNLYSVYGYGGMKGLDCISTSLSLRRSFLKEKRLTVGLSINNPIGHSTRTYASYTVNGDYRGENATRMFNSRSGNLSISYRFGSLKAQVKKTNARITNDDVVGSGQQSQQGNEQ